MKTLRLLAAMAMLSLAGSVASYGEPPNPCIRTQEIKKSDVQQGRAISQASGLSAFLLLRLALGMPLF